MKAYAYKPPSFKFNRFCHRVAARLQAEAILPPALGINILRDVLLVDTSTYEGLINVNAFAASDAMGIIPKASQGNWEDDQFRNTWKNARGRVPRGSYHFFDPLYRPSEQVDEYVSLLGSDPGELPLVVDWEASWTGNYSGWQSLYDFLEALKARIPGRKIYIYTGYYYWLDHSPNPITQAASLNYFAQYGLWLAWYTNDFSIVRIPKPWTDLKWLQFTDSGSGPKYGTQSGAVDLSYYWGTKQQYQAEYNLGGTPLPELNVTKQTFPQSSAVNILVGPGGPPQRTAIRPTVFSSQNNLDWAVNCNSFVYSPTVPDLVTVSGYAVNRGQVISGDIQFEPDIIYISPDNKFSWQKPASVYTAVSCNHVLLQGGVVKTGLDDVNVAARTIIAWNATDFAAIVINGIEGTSYGATLKRAADYIRSLGYTDAGNLDGGGSSTAAAHGVLVSEPHSDNTTAVKERAVATIFGVRTATVGGTMQYKVVWAAGATERLQPSTAGTAQATHANGDVVDAVQNNIPDSADPTNPNKRWCKLVNGHYMATDYPDSNNLPAVRMQLVTTPPPPPPGNTLVVDITVTSKDAAGNVVATYKASNIVLTKQ